MSAAQANRGEGAFSALCMAAFAGVWLYAGLYAATAALMALLSAQLAWQLARHRRAPAGMVAVWALAITLGGLTLWLQNKTYIQLKTSLVYGGFALALLTAEFALGKSLPRLAFARFFGAPAGVWRRVSAAAAAFFAALALCNLAVAKWMSEAAWVGIKTFAFPVATFVFIAVVAFCLSPYFIKEESQ